MRKKYRVTFTCEDSTEPQYTIWAETPEHAIRKAEQKYRSPLVVVNKIAEELKGRK